MSRRSVELQDAGRYSNPLPDQRSVRRTLLRSKLGPQLPDMEPRSAHSFRSELGDEAFRQRLRLVFCGLAVTVSILFFAILLLFFNISASSSAWAEEAGLTVYFQRNWQVFLHASQAEYR